MKQIRRILFLLLNERTYFRIISSLFIFLYSTGLLRIKEKFRVHYFVPQLINKGDTIIDIGANLGYYTRIFARKAGKEGYVWAIEPVPVYREILIRNTRKYKNVKILPFALGNKDASLQMGIPGDQPYRHGLTRIIDKEDENSRTYKVEVRRASVLFGKVEKIDYIKCDIEGYEDKVIPDMADIIKRDKPIIQIEIEKENRKLIFDLLSGMAYRSYKVEKTGLEQFEYNDNSGQDIIFIHKESELIQKYIIN